MIKRQRRSTQWSTKWRLLRVFNESQSDSTSPSNAQEVGRSVVGEEARIMERSIDEEGVGGRVGGRVVGVRNA